MRNPLDTGGKLHFLKNYYIRMRYGAGCCDTYSLYGYVASVISVSLGLFKQRNFSHPSDLTPEQWDGILDEMRDGFEVIAKWKHNDDGEGKRKAERALDLFREMNRLIALDAEEGPLAAPWRRR